MKKLEMATNKSLTNPQRELRCMQCVNGAFNIKLYIVSRVNKLRVIKHEISCFALKQDEC